MKNKSDCAMTPDHDPAAWSESVDAVPFDFGLKRRAFVHLLGTGLMVVFSAPALAQRSGGRGGGASAPSISSRLHFGKDGVITVFTGKVEGGQGARAELTQAAAEELRVEVAAVRLVMADTAQVPNDGITAGSRTTPFTVPAVRQGAAAARELLIEIASRQWTTDRDQLKVQAGAVKDPVSGRSFSYRDLAANDIAVRLLSQPVNAGVQVTPVADWKILGKSTPRPNRRDLVTGAHRFPSDLVRPGMLYGKVLRPPAFGATLTGIDLAPARAMKGVVVVADGQFVGVAAPTVFQARAAIEALAETARWEYVSHPSHQELYGHLEKHAQGGVPANPFPDEISRARKVLREDYHVAYVQHAPLEPRAALAEWEKETLTVSLGTQNPFGCRSELARAFHLAEDKVRVVVPDFGGGFGGKHTGEVGVEAARLARAAGRPVSLRWTRREEFTWAYFRPAALIRIEAGLDETGKLSCWHFLNINSGGAGIETPYQVPHQRSRFVRSQGPLREGSYRALAATANHFARECFMDELAAAVAADPLTFRLAHLQEPRLRAVLETAAQRFGWTDRFARKQPGVGVGLACGTEKGSFVAACVEVAIEPKENRIQVRHICEVFECGAILDPDNTRSQVEGCIIMGLGPALQEEMMFENGEIKNASFQRYRVPRFADVPELDIHLLNRPDLSPVGAGETPIVAVAPAIANAVFHASGVRVRSMPIRLPA